MALNVGKEIAALKLMAVPELREDTPSSPGKGPQGGVVNETIWGQV